MLSGAGGTAKTMDGPTPLEIPARGGSLDTQIIRIKDVHKWYGDFHVLKSINLSIGAGERTVICGPSGSGKSTLIRCLNGLAAFDKGEIYVDGLRLHDARKARAIARQVGMVFQQFNLFPHLSVMRNLTLAPTQVLRIAEAAARERAMHYLDKVRMVSYADKYPNQLSGGQQQRVAIARALCMEPKIMLFDEPTSSLDPELVNEVLETMIALAKSGMTMVCVTHEMNFARNIADRMVFMDDGSLTEVSDTDSFFNRPQCERLKAFLSQMLKH